MTLVETSNDVGACFRLFRHLEVVFNGLGRGVPLIVCRQIFNRWCKFILQSARDFELAALVPWHEIGLGIVLAGELFNLPFAPSTEIVILVKLKTNPALMNQITFLAFDGVFVELRWIRTWFYVDDGLLSKVCTCVVIRKEQLK